MKIFFIRQFAVADEIIPPLHFGYLAGSISFRHKTRIIDQLRDKHSDAKLLDIINREKPDIIGLSGFTKDISSIKALSKKIKGHVTDTKIIVGGVQMTLMPKDSFEYLYNTIDYGFIGESEKAFSSFVESINGGIGAEDRTVNGHCEGFVHVRVEKTTVVIGP